MSEGIKKNGKSFIPYTKPQEIPSVDASLDPLRLSRQFVKVQTSNDPQVQQMSTDQPFSTSMFFNPQFANFDVSQRVSYDGMGDLLFNHQKLLGPFVNSSLDSKLVQKPTDVLQSTSRYINPMMSYFFTSPHQSFYPMIPLQQPSEVTRISNTSLDKQKNKPSNGASVQPLQRQQQQSVTSSTKQNQHHFKKEELKLLCKEESCESEMIKIEESSWNQLKEEKSKNNVKRTRKRCITKESSDSYRVARKKKGPKVNDTKNITKNFSKAIISYILSNDSLLKQFMTSDQYDSFVALLKTKKNQMTNIKQLRDLWVDGGKNSDFNKVFRIISQYFLKNQAVSYVYNSRISNTAWHLKYRQNLLRAMKEPENFKFIKDI